MRAGAVIAAAGATTALANRITMRQLRDQRVGVTEAVTVCVPARDEADRLPELIADLRAQQGVPRLRVLILDDDSGDGTYRAALDSVGGDSRFTVLRNDIPPTLGWTGKNAACARLAEFADTDSGVLIFLDADVRLTPGALAAAIRELRRAGAGLVCPWPAQRAESIAERLVQPLLCWSWASTLPVALGNSTLSPAMAVACGQFLVFDAAAYRAIGGHASVADRITEDLAIARELRRAGQRTTLVAGGQLTSTRMYRSARELDEGYRKWLWTAYGGVAGSAAVGGVTTLAYLLPPLVAAVGHRRVRRMGLLGYAAAVTGRLLARSTENGGRVHRSPLEDYRCGPRPKARRDDDGGRPSENDGRARSPRAVPGAHLIGDIGGLTGADVLAALAHPVSVAVYLGLSMRSHRASRNRTLTWKGRGLSDIR
ncbi:glycosyltransferase [Nocardia sp. NBC_01503]|uniref:glycosyltransferase n=1 Tax=Nocardia sp. NBC_01503 TaxID=2975997 RepID=UPI002E7BC055|nr:glycosyltransferase family 2 protein [Nocardia sp. NBC_01503]WTL32531.1 glycosyltransferase [Nocardia sp. NBC_01503]